MNEMRFKIHIFLTALFSGFAGILPALGCTGRCGSCFQCAGFGGILAILVALRAAGRRKQGEKPDLRIKYMPATSCPPGGDPREMINNFN
ncbi:MAG: hypothetical protein QG578_663 [Thermodesulfobacteriota bacterium]|nr:hypothetical protein [Thermodesulfobacteriota bacterium]